MTRFCTCTALASAVDLSKKRKQFHKITCKTCGRPLVYEIGPPSASMLSTVNPELTWKTVPKGFRSERSRKQAWSLNVDVQQDCRSAKRDELSVSESEKLGVDVLGRHFSDEIKHVPYKKRRFMLQSPSPPPRSPSPRCEQSISSGPQTSSPQPEDFDWTADSKCASSQQLSNSISNQELGSFDGSIAVKSCQCSGNTLANGALSEVTDTKLFYIDDFSGIALLATAACNNSIIDDSQNPKDSQPACEVLTSEGIDISERATPLERSMISSEKGNLFLKSPVHEDNVDGSVLQNSSVAVPQNFHDKIDSETGKRSASIKDERLHWDLNTVMEAWELPHDNQDICFARNDLEHTSDDNVHCVKSEKSEGCARRVGPDNTPELSTISTEATKVSTQVFVDDRSLNISPCPVSNPISNSPLSRENIDTSSKNVVSETREDCSGTSSMQQLIQPATTAEDIHFGKHDVLLDLAVTEKADSIQQNTDSKEAFDLIDTGTSSTELASSITNVEYSVCKLGKEHPSYPSPECENVYALDANLGLQPAVAVDVERKQHKNVPGAHATPRESSLRVDLNDPESFQSLGKVGVEVRSDDGYDSDVSPGDHVGTISAKKMTGSKAGYESPFEDGELRESGLYSWEEENEVEGEIERVDYDSDNRDEDDLDVAPHCMPDVGSESCENDNNGSLAEIVMQSGRPNALKESSLSVSLNKISEQGKLPEGCECSTNREGEANNKVLVSNSTRGLDIEGSSTGEVRSRETGEKLSSRIEGPSVSDGLQRKNRGSYDSYFQAGKVSPSAKYLGRDRPARPMLNESQGDDQWIDSPTGYWDSRNNYHQGHSQGTGRFRPTRNSASSAMRIDEFAYCHRRSINHSLKGDFRPAIKRISGNGDAYSVRDTISATDNSRIRRRGRYEIYQQGVSRGPRVEYRGPMFDDPASSSVRLSHDLARRERSVSPVLSRGASFSQYHWKSRSRSRTRSPLAWHIQRERNMGARRVSRSPDFRSDARMQRTRMPFQNSDFAEDGEDVFMSPSRNHFSPQRHSRWVDDRNYVGPRFRQRKSPGRFFWRNPRFGSGGGSGRMMPDDRPRSTTRPGRFTELSAGTGRAHKYNGNDYERTKYSDKYEMIHQVKRSDPSGTLKRFRYDPEDFFEVHSSRNDRRDIPRSARE